MEGGIFFGFLVSCFCCCCVKRRFDAGPCVPMETESGKKIFVLRLPADLPKETGGRGISRRSPYLLAFYTCSVFMFGRRSNAL